MQLAAQLYEHRALVWRRAATDLRYRYSATTFGLLWTILHPLALIATYSIVFGMIIKRQAVGAPFPIVLCAGLLPWQALTECITRSCQAFLQNKAYLKKLPVPEPVYIGQVVVSAAVGLGISMSLLLLATIAVGVGPSWTWLLLPIPVISLLCLGFGIGLALGTLNAFVRDIGEVVPVALRVGMWLVPVIFPFSFYDRAGFGWIVELMPPTPALYAIRELLVYGTTPGWATWVGMLAWVAVAWLVGTTVLRRLRAEIRDVL